MWTTRRLFVVVALIAGWVRGAAAGEAPKLQYGFEADKHYGYDITIKVETDDYTSTYTGHTLFWLVSAQDDRITLHCEGSLPAKVKRKRANDLTDYGIHGLSSRSVQLAIDRRGKPQRARRGLEPLPFVLGSLETLTLERLPAEPQDQWKCEEEFEIAEGRFGIHMKLPSRKAKEESEYTITGVEGDLVRMDKTYLMRTGEAAGPYRSASSRVRMDGSGSVVFDRRAGVVSSINMNYTLLLKREDDSRTVTALVDCRLMTPERLEQLITELDNKRKQVTGEVYAELPKKPLQPTERAKLLRDLCSQDPKVVEAAIVRLISAERDDRPADESQFEFGVFPEGLVFRPEEIYLLQRIPVRPPGEGDAAPPARRA